MLRLWNAARWTPEPAEPPDGGNILVSCRDLRSDIQERIREVTEVSEREVLAAGASVQRVVELASTQIEGLGQIVRQGEAEPGLGESDRQAANTQAFLRTLHVSLDEHAKSAARSREHATVISDTARRVGALASQARLLAINARIEAAHAGVAGGAFGILAGEMRRLAEEIAAANAVIEDLVREISEFAPRVAASVTAIERETDGFSASLEESLRLTEEQRVRAAQAAKVALERSDATTREILQVALETLSHLQFQDVAAQGLMRIDMRLHQHQLEVCRALGLDAATQNFPKPMHVELGGDKPVDAPEAGVVQLF